MQVGSQEMNCGTKALPAGASQSTYGRAQTGYNLLSFLYYKLILAVSETNTARQNTVKVLNHRQSTIMVRNGSPYFRHLKLVSLRCASFFQGESRNELSLCILWHHIIIQCMVDWLSTFNQNVYRQTYEERTSFQVSSSGCSISVCLLSHFDLRRRCGSTYRGC
jgi:hypothetical protein